MVSPSEVLNPIAKLYQTVETLYWSPPAETGDVLKDFAPHCLSSKIRATIADHSSCKNYACHPVYSYRIALDFGARLRSAPSIYSVDPYFELPTETDYEVQIQVDKIIEASGNIVYALSIVMDGWRNTFTDKNLETCQSLNSDPLLWVFEGRRPGEFTQRVLQALFAQYSICPDIKLPLEAWGMCYLVEV